MTKVGEYDKEARSGRSLLNKRCKWAAVQGSWEPWGLEGRVKNHHAPTRKKEKKRGESSG